MAQSMPGGTSLPPLSGDQIRELLKGPKLERIPDVRPGQCTTDDPTGAKSNGTQGRVYTQELRAWDPKEDERRKAAMAKTQACAASAFSCAAVMFKDNFDVQSVKGSAEMGGIKGEGGWNSDVGLNGQVSGAGGKLSWDEKNGLGGELDTKKTADYLKKKREEDAKKEDDKKKKRKPHIEGQVCIVKKGDTKKDGSWFTIEGKAGNLTHRMGFPDGNWCVGYDSTPGLSGSIKGPSP